MVGISGHLDGITDGELGLRELPLIRYVLRKYAS